MNVLDFLFEFCTIQGRFQVFNIVVACFIKSIYCRLVNSFKQ